MRLYFIGHFAFYALILLFSPLGGGSEPGNNTNLPLIVLSVEELDYDNLFFPPDTLFPSPQKNGF